MFELCDDKLDQPNGPRVATIAFLESVIMSSPKQSFDIEMVENHPDPSLTGLSDDELVIEKRYVK